MQITLIRGGADYSWFVDHIFSISSSNGKWIYVVESAHMVLEHGHLMWSYKLFEYISFDKLSSVCNYVTLLCFYSCDWCV